MGCVYSRASCIGEICAPRNVDVKEPENVKAAEIPVFSPASSDGEDGEIRDQINQLSLSRDNEIGITRLSRVSAQFLPPDGSRIVKVPSGNYELQCSFLSQRGYYPDALDKANQDSFCIHTPFGTSPDDHFFGVFDGHGEYGAQCSQFAKKKLCENLLRNSKFHLDAVEACHAAFLMTNTQLHADAIDDSMSGTTAITILVRGTTLYVANSGDSRAVIAERRGNEVVAVDLSIDQTPFRPDEVERVKMCGARVLTLDQIEGLKNPDVQCWDTEEGDDGDPPRLWVQNGMYPGTAFTRSIGDSVAETIGVVANPEIVVFKLTSDHPFFVIASDGVFEFLSSQTVVDMAAKYKDPRDACAAIVAESYRLWLQYETRTDDITVIVVQVNGLTNVAVGQSTSSDVFLRPPLPQVVELSGSESPSVMNWNSRIQRARQDISRARLRAIESSVENGQIWVPPSPAHRKTWEEEAQIERVLHDHFLFRKLTDSQAQVLLDCMQRVEVEAGDIVVKQGGECDSFYVIGSGEFEVLAIQDEKNGEVPRVLQHYTADKLSSFGELALMYNKPLQASVRAVTSGILWELKREDFRGILMSEFSNLSSLKLLRSIDLLSRLTILQLSHIADLVSEVPFSDGQTIVNEKQEPLGLYIIQKGVVKITFDMDLVKFENASSLMCENLKQDDIQNKKGVTVEKSEGSYFGEWTLLGEHIASLSVIAVGDVVCAILTKEKFDSVVGPLAKLSQDDLKAKGHQTIFSSESVQSLDTSMLASLQLSDLEWQTCLYSTDCSEIGLVRLRDSDKLLSLKRFSKQKIKKLGKEVQVLKEKNLLTQMNTVASIPRVLCTCADETHAGILLDTCLACSVVAILHNPLDEESACFCAASVVIALEDLHNQNGILYRGVSPDVLMLDKTGHIQLAEFRFAKKISSELDERTFTICGMADSLAPEIVQGKGHGFAADWWALGTLIYFMLQGEMPFGSRRESELTFARIAKGQLTLPHTFSQEAVDLITKLLQVDEKLRLGSQGADSLKSHPWFFGVDWKAVADHRSPVPAEILSRISQRMENHGDENIASLQSPICDLEELNTPEWLQDW
ncbi:protein phosphatase 2C and cyclic nucleotide-binding/kinase domain-containing protein isoform X1 [Lycium barbarum]|uniref:protein phosphatase 2C and cyclic nucleotide-binding/kinase domain-containing protein isoform X1 n=1 Tax=Lycium barbarum TaxID=112863 RepID=UPI00293EEA88|nr:protein phosphatase 2C and cyclic nucleotide-binding/kinase domain-containing protein isoform X1 [Lycium barbarum]XP_060213948.1 protein phosphatase 2C and cyclic nucleotide-binding/kinase domain-containing protein isoform X1 [Lycium barbarum]XP_060213949.1 protein phosphatase 2C and cyclic nucleotide-binding/kinase domain-containing protein isoform X1 [Lycium barbarum]XP_060213950.1 protein phosphatase 2C and cyclic nucleotide-binding/kinase domain-containing protein isoform X1 [Lycium barba